MKKYQCIHLFAYLMKNTCELVIILVSFWHRNSQSSLQHYWMQNLTPQQDFLTRQEKNIHEKYQCIHLFAHLMNNTLNLIILATFWHPNSLDLTKFISTLLTMRNITPQEKKKSVKKTPMHTYNYLHILWIKHVNLIILATFWDPNFLD